ncbi:matrixin family metalloprotease [uncultured Kriegella sp.]|uniref:matrixin family metalloprotease n=1 Tax=uncultured Kriegella sp. TaxID=1798910 RepID=UPI0030D90A18
MKKQENISVQQAVLDTATKSYVPQTSNLKKGSKGINVERLHQYLTKFGYFEDNISAEFSGVALKTDLPSSPKNKEQFDQNTELALEKFQELNGLKVTGELDKSTLELMKKPRCGFTDTAAFIAQGNKWPTNALTYGFQNFSSDLTQGEVRTAISEALGLWSAVTPLTFTEVPFSNNPHIKIRFESGSHGDGNTFDGPGGVLAHAYYPPPNGGDIAGDAHFDEAETWSVNLPASGIDLVTVAAHEFGHSLGLAHSTISGALMYPYYGGPHRNLEADDVAGIQSIYGAATQWSGWERLGGVLTSGAGACSWASGRLDTFVRGTDMALWHKWYSGGWSGWERLGGVITANPAAVSWSNGRIDTFVRGTDMALWHKWYSGGWSGWERLGGGLSSGPAVCSWSAGRLDVFVRGNDMALWHKWYNGRWSGWERLGGVLTSDPAAVSWSNGRIDVFVRGSDNALWHKWYSNGWSGWERLGGGLSSGPAVCSWSAGRLDVFVRGNDMALWHKWYNSGWSGWERLGGTLSSDPEAVSWGNGRIDVFAKGTDAALWHKWYPTS